MLKPSGRTPLYPRVQSWGEDDFIFLVRPLTIPTLRLGRGGRREYSRCCELLSFYRLDVSSSCPSPSFGRCSSARVCAFYKSLAVMEPQPPRMSKEEKRLAWTWQQEGRTQAEIAKLLSRSRASVSLLWCPYSACTVPARCLHGACTVPATVPAWKSLAQMQICARVK